MINLKDLEIIDQDQKLYDGFNNFILSSDTKVFGKLLARSLLFNQIKDVPGDIVECGVFKGTGILTFLKLKKFLSPNSVKKIIGFDYFDTKSLLNGLVDKDKEAMSALFSGRDFSHDNFYYEYLKNLIISCGFKDHDFNLIKGDVSETVPKFLENRPGMKISLLYLDLDLEKPTYDVLNCAWERVSRGGIIVFDEYGFHNWSESKGVDRFLENKNIEIKSLNFIAPSAYIKKV